MSIKDRLRDTAQRMKNINCLNEAALMLEVASINERLESDNANLLAANRDSMDWFNAATARAEKAEAALAKAREAALEEAAMVVLRYAVDFNANYHPRRLVEDGRGELDVVRTTYASAIRALKEKKIPRKPNRQS